MKVLITGAFGNLGLMCVHQALALGYEVKCFDLKTDKNAKQAAQFPSITTIFGDIRDPSVLEAIVEGVDAIIHNASVLPPVTDNNPELARQINVESCEKLIQVAQRSSKKPVFVFPSSVTVFAQPESSCSLKNASDPIAATDNYTQHKIDIECYLKATSLPWVILRVGVSVDARTLATDRKTFKKLLNVKASNPLEYVHPKDVALAMCKAVNNKQAIGKVLLIGGGASCQISQRQFLSTAFHSLGLQLPLTAHGGESFYTHWMDTTESQNILQYQQHDFSAYTTEMDKTLLPLKIILFPFRWLINLALPSVLKAI